MRNLLCHSGPSSGFQSVGLLLLRLSGGILMLVLHGWGNIKSLKTALTAFLIPSG